MTGSDDVEAATAAGGGMVGGDDDDNVGPYDPFDIATTKNASVQTLKRWRVRLDSTSSLVMLLRVLCFNAVSLMIIVIIELSVLFLFVLFYQGM